MWDDIEPYLRGLLDDSIDEIKRPGMTSPVQNRNKPDTSFRVHQDDDLSPSAVRNSWTPDVDGSAMEEVAAAIQSDVEVIKARYIVGKTVGRDLYGEEGQRLARQGDPITIETVRAVEEAGLLVDLIEYMTFETFED